MVRDDSITILIPALNEEQHLEGVVQKAVDFASSRFAEYEILVYNDGSTDRTGELADQLAAANPQVFAFHNRRPSRIGGALRDGYARARMKYVVWLDSKGWTPREALEQLFAQREKTDLVIAYTSNWDERPRGRRFVGKTFRGLLNLLFRLDLQQYTHMILFRPALAGRFEIHTTSYAYHAELLIKLIKSGCSYVEVGVRDDFDFSGRSSRAFSLSNFVTVGMFFLRTLWDVYVLRTPQRFAAAQRKKATKTADSSETENKVLCAK